MGDTSQPAQPRAARGARGCLLCPGRIGAPRMRCYWLDPLHLGTRQEKPGPERRGWFLQAASGPERSALLREPQSLSSETPCLLTPLWGAGLCLALGPPVNDPGTCHIATPTCAPYLPAQGHKPDSPITTGPPGSPGPATTSTGSEATWKSSKPWGGGAHDPALMCTTLAAARPDAPWTPSPPSAK